MSPMAPTVADTVSSSTMENVDIDMPPPSPRSQPRDVALLSSSSSSSFTDLHVQQVSSALHNQGGRCMSIGGVEQMFWNSAQPISRSTASQLLEHIATTASSSSKDSKYQATYCRWSESSNSDGNADEKATSDTVPCTTFKLCTEDFDSEQKMRAGVDETRQVLYALSVVAPSSSHHAMAESLSTAHERDMAQLRDRLLAVSGNNAEQDAMWDCTVAQDVLCSAKELAMSSSTASSRNSSHDVDMQQDHDVVTSSQAAATAGGGGGFPNKRLPPVNNNGKKKAVSAKSFFGTTSSTTAATAAASKKSAVKSSAAAATTTSKKQADGKKAPQTVSSSNNKFFKTQPPRGPAEEKENNRSKKEPSSSTSTPADSKKKPSSKKPVGTADDFIGDMDDDDDDEDSGDDNSAKNANDVDMVKAEIRGRDKPPSRGGGSQDDPMQVDDVNNDEDDVDSGILIAPVEGAMDAFVKTAVPDASSSTYGVAGTKQKRRRKRLVDKTTVDASGYLHTETQEIWEDVPSDEEDERQKAVAAAAAVKKKKPATTSTTTTSNAAKKKKATKPSGMKQGSLVGFFKKK